MLRALRRVLRPGGRLAFSTIEAAPGLTRTERRKLEPAAPRAIGSRWPYAEMLRRAGYVDIGERDVTAEYLDTVRGWIAATEPVRDLAAEVDGAAAVEERLALWHDAAEMIGRGWLRRSIYWAASP